MSVFQGPEDLTRAETTDVYGLGTHYVNPNTGKQYCWCLNSGADSIAAGDCAGLYTTTPAEATVSSTTATIMDFYDGTTHTAACAGIGLGTCASGSYCWLQVAGLCTNVTTDGGVAKGDYLVMDGGSTATDNAETAVAADMGAQFGYALADDVATAAPLVYLTNCVLAI